MNVLKFNTKQRIIPAFILSMILFSLPGQADSQARFSTGEAVYVSIYSNIYAGSNKLAFQLAAMLNIRNTDPNCPITILKADYYDNHGKMIDRYVKDPIELGPLASTHFYIKEYDKRGGPGANFIVKWRSEKEVNQPIIEGLMLGLFSGQGVSFTCPGQTIKEDDN